MTSSISIKTSTNKSSSNMTSSSANTKNYNKNYKKIEEVREVIQNKPESDIIKVLEYFDNDVGKTIDAFLSGNLFSYSYLI